MFWLYWYYYHSLADNHKSQSNELTVLAADFHFHFHLDLDVNYIMMRDETSNDQCDLLFWSIFGSKINFEVSRPQYCGAWEPFYTTVAHRQKNLP
jgi:hypothetical protein